MSALVATLMVALAVQANPSRHGIGMAVVTGSSDSALIFLAPASIGVAAPAVLILSGDGDWAAFDRGLADSLNRRGVPVIGLKSRTWLSRPRTPDETATMLDHAIRAGERRWGERRLVIVGYSRGADFAPFAINRWPAERRKQIEVVILIGLGEWASFEFRVMDLIRDTRRPTDLATRPEVERLTGLRLLCVSGADERDSFCRKPVAGMELLEHRGGHRLSAEGEFIGLLLQKMTLGVP